MPHRGLLPMGPVDQPSFRFQIRKGRLPIRPLPITVTGIAGYQMPAAPVEIETGVLAHNPLLPLLFRRPQFHFKNNRRNFIAMRLFARGCAGVPRLLYASTPGRRAQASARSRS
jgi:hypothetical protein